MAGRNVYQITLPHVHPASKKPVYFMFECSLASLEALISEFNSGKLVQGFRLWTASENDEQGWCLRVREKQPVALAGCGIAMINVPQMRVVEYEE